MSSHICTLISATGLVVSKPALLNRMSTSPSALTMAAKARLTCFSSPTSAAAAITLALRFLAMCAATFFAASPFLSMMATRAPSLAKRSAIAWPMPLAPPVIAAVFPVSLPMPVPP